MLTNREKDLSVLVVEDETIIAVNICNTLQQYGYDTQYTTSGESAIAMVQEKKPDVILMDIMLGAGLDGIETAISIRKEFDIPVIFLTAFSDESTVSRAQVTEPFGYLIKPFHARELYIAIELAIYKHHSLMSMAEMQSRLFESQRLESIGLLSSGIAHEINNPLMSIVNFATMGQKLADGQDSEKAKEYFCTIQSEAEKIGTIVRSLVNYAREDRDNWYYANLTFLTRDLLGLFNQLFIRDGITAELDLDDSLPDLYCKPQKTKQAILNLISFCRTSCLEDQGSQSHWIRIKTYSQEIQGEPWIHFEISDSGDGIRNQILGKKSASEKDPPTNVSLAGLGYHLSVAIIHEHKGQIQAYFKDSIPILKLSIPLRHQA